MSKLRCVNCNSLFTPAPQVPNQTFCSSPACQKERRKQWHKSRMQSDEHYRENRSDAQKSWAAKNPDYWRNRQQAKSNDRDFSPSKQQPRVKKSKQPSVKMDSLIPAQNLGQAIQDGVFRLKVLVPPDHIKMDVWIVELSFIHAGSRPISDSSR